MKTATLLLFMLASIAGYSQATTVYSRLTDKVGTVPASDTITGVVKVDTAYSSTYKYLRYIGTTNIANIFTNGSIGNYGWMYVYIPSDSIVAKVMSVAAVGDATLDTFRIQVDRSIIMTGSKPLKSIKAKDFSYTWQNDGGGAGYVNGVSIVSGTNFTIGKDDIVGTSQTTWQDPIIINAGGTSFLIIERKQP